MSKREAMLKWLESAIESAHRLLDDEAQRDRRIKRIEAQIRAVNKPMTFIKLPVTDDMRLEYLYNDKSHRIWQITWTGCKMTRLDYQMSPDMQMESWEVLRSHPIVTMADIYKAILEGIL